MASSRVSICQSVAHIRHASSSVTALTASIGWHTPLFYQLQYIYISADRLSRAKSIQVHYQRVKQVVTFMCNKGDHAVTDMRQRNRRLHWFIQNAKETARSLVGDMIRGSIRPCCFCLVAPLAYAPALR
jgi:hypothetical protein